MDNPQMTDYRENKIAEIKEAMEEQGLSMLALSKLANVKYDIIRDMFRGKTKMTNAESMEKINSALGLLGEPYHIETEQLIPAYESIAVAAGAPQILSEPARPELAIAYRTRKQNVRAIKVEPDSYSMNRHAIPGQYLIVDFDQTDMDELDGKLVIACVEGACTFKRWKRNPDTLIPESTYPDYHTISVNRHDQFRIIGRVIDVVADRKDFE